jgi:ADP-heptose:LPS heptosyltransferase
MGGQRPLKEDRKRSIPAELMAELLTLPLKFVCLHKEISKEDQPVVAEAENLQWVGPLLGDFADTASLIQNLDLVITVDTALAHLAGALGKEVWILLPFAPDFRWMLDRTDSPWYPTAKLYRQKSPGDWSSVISDVTSALMARYGLAAEARR